MSDYERIAAVIRFLDENRDSQPDLDQLAGHAGLSRHHFHRLFVRWAGITPKAFLQCLTVEHARSLLEEGKAVLDAALESGLSGPSRLHDLTLSLEAATPGEIKTGGEGWEVLVGHAPTPFGDCRIAEGPRGICDISFVDGESRDDSLQSVQERWHGASVTWSTQNARRLGREIFRASGPDSESQPLRVLVAGTRFQVQVWRALLAIPPGAVASYGDVARKVGASGSARAVGSAVGQNALAFLIPCHRVIRETGVLGGYRWGGDRKQAMLAWESASRG